MTVSDIGNAPQPARAGGIARTQAAEHRAGLGQNAAFERLSVGQIVNVHVLRRFDTGRYLISIDGQRHHVDSTAELRVGARGRAEVTAIPGAGSAAGARLELRIAELQDPSSATAEATDAPLGGATLDTRARQVVADLEGRFRMALDDADRATLANVVAGAAQPDTMARSGLFLNRLGMTIAPAAAQSIYAAQVGAALHTKNADAASAAAPEIGALAAAIMSGDAQALEALQQLLIDAANDADVPAPDAQAAGVASNAPDADAAFTGVGADAGGQRHAAQQEMARWLLNLQDDGTVGHRYGTLPVLVAGQLVELDLVLFRQRQFDDRALAGREPLRRLVMTLTTESFGRLQVTAEAVENRLLIAFTGRSAVEVQALSGYGDDVRQLAQRLGWNVDQVHYGCDPHQRRAAAHIVDRALDAGSIDRVL